MAIRPTLEQVAKEAGVSKATACKVLNGYHHVSEKTKNAVENAVRRLKYTPDPALSELAAARWRQLPSQRGTVIAWLQVKPLSEYRIYRESAQKRALELGMKVEVFLLDDYKSANHLTKVLVQRGIRALLIGPQLQKTLLDDLDLGRFAAVGCNRGHHEVGCISVVPDYFHAFSMAIRKLVSCGYKRIGLAVGTHVPVHIDDRLREGACLQAMSEHTLPSIPLWKELFGDKASFLKWVRQYEPEAVVGVHVGLYYWLRDAGYIMPRDLGFAGIHTEPLRDKEISGVDIKYAYMGARAVDQIALMLRTREQGTPDPGYTVFVQGSWLTGKTIRDSAAENQSK